jgi:hypothetical protein
VTAPSAPPPAAPHPNDRPTSGVVALVMGLLGLTVLPLVGSILALVFGYQSRREVAAEPARYVDDLGRVGRVLGWVGIGLAALMLLAVVAAVAFFMAV